MSLWFVMLCLIAVFTEGTGGGGDSIQHFLFSKYAFTHPELFLNHWAKPVFVLLSAPFAQFGFLGMKIFNCLVATLTGYLTYRTSQLLGLKDSFLALVFLLFAPLYFTLIFSGLTEPLFALVLILGIYLTLMNKGLSAAIVISFLPFVRSEGLIVIGVFAFYFLLKRHFKLLPLLLSGHIFFGIVGFIYYQDLLWVFNKIPYASMGSPYGSGELFAFFSKMNYTIGVPLYLLLSMGVIFMISSFFVKSLRSKHSLYHVELILIYGSFAAVFVAHSLFWYLGIFNSMGLKRVLIGLMPLIAIIALNGYHFLTHEQLTKRRIINYGLRIILVVYVLVFPFTPNPAAVNWNKDFSLGADQVIVDEIAELVIADFPGYHLFYSDPYLSFALKIDPFDTTLHQSLIDFSNAENIPENTLVIWDNWFSVIENGVTLDALHIKHDLEEISTYETKMYGRNFKYVVLQPL